MPEEGLHLHGRVRTQAHECGVNRRFSFQFETSVQKQIQSGDSRRTPKRLTHCYPIVLLLISHSLSVTCRTP